MAGKNGNIITKQTKKKNSNVISFDINYGQLYCQKKKDIDNSATSAKNKENSIETNSR